MARTGMTALLEELRSLTEAGTAEYTIGTTAYFSDNSLQDVLDNHRMDFVHEYIQPMPIVATGGTLQYFDYHAPYTFLESTSGGSTVFYIQDGTGATLGTSLWSADYRRGLITFGSNTLGTTLYLTGRTYDLNATAADIWRKKAAHYAPTSFNFSTDNHNVSREQVYSHCIEMAGFFEGMSGNSIQVVERFRSDTNAGY